MFYLLAAAALYALGYSEGKVARPALLLGLAIHLVFIVQRTVFLQRIPVTERLDIFSLIGWLMIVMIFYAWRRYEAYGIELPLISFAVIFTLAASLHAPVNSVDIFMVSPWFYLYSALNITSYVLLGMATSFGLMYVLGNKEGFERLQYKYTLYGWSVFSASLITGSVWFFMSTGSYWYWTARELWLSIIWLAYGGVYLHIRYVKEFSGRPVAVIGVLVYPMLLFYYFGIGTLVKSPWSQF